MFPPEHALLSVAPDSISFLRLAPYLVNTSAGNAAELKVHMLIGVHGALPVPPVPEPPIPEPPVPVPLAPEAATNAVVTAVTRSVADEPAGIEIADATAVAMSVDVNVGNGLG